MRGGRRATGEMLRPVRSDSRCRALGALLLVGGLGLGALSSCGSNGAGSTDPREVTAVRADYYASEYGVRVGVRVGYGEPREVTAARLVAGDESVDAALYPLDGTDPDAPPESVVLARDERVSLEGTLLVPCPGARETPVFEVTSVSNGSQRTDYFEPMNTAGYQQAVDEWCDRPITMNVTGSSATPEGDYELRVQFSNPGPEPVEVTSAQVDDGASSWQEATVVVPAGIEEMTIHGHGPPDCAVTPPWESGHVSVDGEIIRPESPDWC
jgi:hypothetical protein